MSRQLRLFVNALEQQLIASPQSTSLGSIRPIITGEKLVVDVVPIKRVEAGSVFWELDRSYEDDTFRIGAGVVNTPPELGDFKVTYGASTSAALSFDATADEWSTALNAMTDVTSDGGVTVSGNYERGYRISWVTAGAKSDFGSDEVNLIPESSVSFSMEKEGATGIKEVVVARMQRSPAGLVTSVIPIPAGAATVSVRATGNKATREIVEITCVGDTAAIAQVEEATCVAVGGVKHVASITTVADVSDSLDGKYFVLYDDEGSVAFWIDTDNSGTTIPGGAAVYDRFVEITTINTNDSDGAVAQKVKAAVDADLKFSATVLGAVVTVTYSTVGAHGAAAAGSSGFTPATVTSGASTDNYDGTYFYLYAASTGAIVGFWFSQDGDTPPPAGALALTSDLTLITGYEPDATAMDMATLIASSIHAKTPFTAVASGTEVHITQNTAGAVSDLNAGDSPLTGETVVVNGADSTLNGKHFLLWETDGAGGEISRSVWFNISGTASPSGTALTATQSTEILSIVTGDNAVDVAAALATKLDSLAGYRATAHGTKVRVESSVAYNFTDWSAETSGFTFTKTQNGAGGTDANAVVEVKFSEDCIGGVYSLGVDTGGGSITSEGIPWSATALEVTGLLEKLSNVGTGNVIVEGAGGGDLRLSFREDLANTAITVTVDDSALVWLEGVRATINFATTSAEALLYGLNTLDAIFEVEALAQDGVSYRTKLLHEPVVLKNGLLGISTLAPLPLPDYYDATTVDGLIIHHLKAITSLTGGTSSDLDSVATVDITPKRAVFIYDGDNERYAVYVLEAGTDAESAPLVIRPDDYDGSTNAKVWKLMRTPTESSFSEKTIATGAITVTSSFHSVDTEANAASDDLDTVSGGASWKVAYLRANNAARAVVIKHGTGNIKCWGDTDITLDSLSKYALFVWDDENSVWLAMSGTTGSSGIADGSVTAAKLASDSVTTAKILDGNVTAAKLASDAVTTAKVLDAAITPAKMANIDHGKIIGRKTSGAGVREELTLSEILDLIGSAAQGDILYRGASGWARLGAGTSGHFFKTLGPGADPLWAAVIASGGDSVSKAIAQTGHGFAVGDCVGYSSSGSTWVGGQANSITTIGTGIVSAVADVDNFTVTTSGYISGLSGLSTGAWYYQSDATPGALTTTPPTAADSYVVPVLYAVSTTAGYVIPPIPHARGQSLLPKLDFGASALATGDDLTYASGAWVAKSLADYSALTSIATDDGFRVWDTSAGVWKSITPVELLKVVNSLTADASPDLASDYALTYDASAGTVKKVLLNLIGGSGDCVLLDSATASSSAALTFDGVFTSDYDVYRIDLIDIAPATDSVGLLFRWRDAGSDVTGTAHYTGFNYTTPILATSQGTSYANSTSGHPCPYTDLGNAAGETTTLTVWAFPRSTVRKVITFSGYYYNYLGNMIGVPGGMSTLANTTAMSGFKLLYNSGNIASGKVRVTGYKNS